MNPNILFENQNNIYNLQMQKIKIATGKRKGLLARFAPS